MLTTHSKHILDGTVQSTHIFKRHRSSTAQPHRCAVKVGHISTDTGPTNPTRDRHTDTLFIRPQHKTTHLYYAGPAAPRRTRREPEVPNTKAGFS